MCSMVQFRHAKVSYFNEDSLNKTTIKHQNWSILMSVCIKQVPMYVIDIIQSHTLEFHSEKTHIISKCYGLPVHLPYIVITCACIGKNKNVL